MFQMGCVEVLVRWQGAWGGLWRLGMDMNLSELEGVIRESQISLGLDFRTH